MFAISTDPEILIHLFTVRKKLSLTWYKNITLQEIEWYFGNVQYWSIICRTKWLANDVIVAPDPLLCEIAMSVAH